MVSAAAIGRRGSANNARVAAKQRRQKILAARARCRARRAARVRGPAPAASAPAAAARRRCPPLRPHRLRNTCRGTEAGAAPTRSQPSRCRTVTPARSAGGGPDPFTRSSGSSSSLRRSRDGRAPEPDRDRPAGRSQGREARLDRHPRLDPDRERARTRLCASRTERAGASAGSRSSTRRTAGRCAAATGSSTRAPTRRSRAVSRRAGSVHAAGYRIGLHPRADRRTSNNPLHVRNPHGRIRIRRNQRPGARDLGRHPRAGRRAPPASSCRRAGSCRSRWPSAPPPASAGRAARSRR